MSTEEEMGLLIFLAKRGSLHPCKMLRSMFWAIRAVSLV